MSVFLALFALSYTSWVLLCLGLPRHYQQHFEKLPSAALARGLRVAGWLALVACYALGVYLRGWSMGSVDVAAAWMVAAIVWLLLQTFQQRVARWLAPATTALALLALISH